MLGNFRTRLIRLFQYMLLLRGATTLVFPCALRMRVSIHAPLARSNRDVKLEDLPLDVSIHAPLARSYSSVPPRRTCSASFNTCSSCEEQLQCFPHCCRWWFQYMLLLRGATPLLYQITMHLLVSIHVPLARSNPWYSPSCRRGDSFNTCSSCEVQLRLQRLGSNGTFVSIHAPLARSNMT